MELRALFATLAPGAPIAAATQSAPVRHQDAKPRDAKPPEGLGYGIPFGCLHS